jgi:hypothetical protein
MGMTFRKLRFHVFLVSAFGLLVSIGTAQGQTIVITAKSVSQLADDLEYLIKSVAPEGDPRAQTVLDGLARFKSGALIKGLDQGRGFGLAVTLPKDFPQGDPPTIVAAVPVTDLGQFLDSLKELGLAVDDQPGVAGFSHKVSAPNGNPSAFVLQSKGYALFSMVPGGIDQLKALDPSSWKPKGRAEPALSVRVQLSEIPEALKDQVLAQVDVQADQQNERKPGEKDAEYQARLKGQKFAIEAMKSLIRDGDAITLDLDVDRKTSEVSLEFTMSGKPNTAMAKSLRALNGRRSRFQGLSKESAMAGWANFPVAKEFRDLMIEAFDQAAQEGLKKLDTEEEKKLATRLAELVRSNLNAPEIDMGMTIEGTSVAGADAPRFVLLGGMTVQKGGEFERLVREAATTIKPEEKVKITFDVAKAADGTAIHQLSGPFDEKDADMAKHFGKASLFFAFRQDAVLFSFGESGLPPLRKAMEGFSNPPVPELDEPIAILMHLAKAGAFADTNQESFRRAASEALQGANAKRDRMHIGLKGEGDALRLRLALDVPALKLMATLGGQLSKKP